MQDRAGFTLVELSIVLIVIGLIVSGIIIGQSLIRQSQINSAAVDEQKYVQAVQNFQQKYGALPGDMTSATTYWGAMSTCPPTAGSASAGGTLTCNGNGDGQIGNPTGASPTVAETFTVWQHLVNAGMIQGYYNGIAASGGVAAPNIGVNIPSSRMDGAGFAIDYLGPLSGNATYFDNIYGHVIFFGGSTTTGLYTPLLTGTEALAFDQKYDDGTPGNGRILSVKHGFSSSPNCSSTTSASTAAYQASFSGYQCFLLFITGF